MTEPYLDQLPATEFVDCPHVLMTESTVRMDGVGPAIALSPELDGKLAVVTLGVTRIVEQQGLIVSIWGSSDNADWGSRPLASFPQKYYCGTSSVLLNLAKHRHVRFLRVKWQMKRWARREAAALSAFYVFAEESGTRLKSRAAVAAADRSPVPPDSRSLPISFTPEIAYK